MRQQGVPPRNPELFANAQAALDGTPFPSSGSVLKLLHYVCADPVGCDVVITDDDLIENFASTPASRSIHGLAPGLICTLRELAHEPVSVPGRTTPSFTIGPVTVDDPETGMRWSYPRRRIWLVATPVQITILIRATISDEDTTTPSLIQRPHRMVEIEGGCPHCGVTVPSYRQLSGGGLICGPCGRSFEPEQRGRG